MATIFVITLAILSRIRCESPTPLPYGVFTNEEVLRNSEVSYYSYTTFPNFQTVFDVHTTLQDECEMECYVSSKLNNPSSGEYFHEYSLHLTPTTPNDRLTITESFSHEMTWRLSIENVHANCTNKYTIRVTVVMNRTTFVILIIGAVVCVVIVVVTLFIIGGGFIYCFCQLVENIKEKRNKNDVGKISFVKNTETGTGIVSGRESRESVSSSASEFDIELKDPTQKNEKNGSGKEVIVINDENESDDEDDDPLDGADPMKKKKKKKRKTPKKDRVKLKKYRKENKLLKNLKNQIETEKDDLARELEKERERSRILKLENKGLKEKEKEVEMIVSGKVEKTSQFKSLEKEMQEQTARMVETEKSLSQEVRDVERKNEEISVLQGLLHNNKMRVINFQNSQRASSQRLNNVLSKKKLGKELVKRDDENSELREVVDKQRKEIWVLRNMNEKIRERNQVIYTRLVRFQEKVAKRFNEISESKRGEIMKIANSVRDKVKYERLIIQENQVLFLRTEKRKMNIEKESVMKNLMKRFEDESSLSSSKEKLSDKRKEIMRKLQHEINKLHQKYLSLNHKILEKEKEIANEKQVLVRVKASLKCITGEALYYSILSHSSITTLPIDIEHKSYRSPEERAMIIQEVNNHAKFCAQKGSAPNEFRVDNRFLFLFGSVEFEKKKEICFITEKRELSLFEYVTRNRIEVSEKMEILKDCAETYFEIHAKKKVHHGISPEKVYVFFIGRSAVRNEHRKKRAFFKISSFENIQRDNSNFKFNRNIFATNSRESNRFIDPCILDFVSPTESALLGTTNRKKKDDDVFKYDVYSFGLFIFSVIFEQLPFEMFLSNLQLEYPLFVESLLPNAIQKYRKKYPKLAISEILLKDVEPKTDVEKKTIELVKKCIVEPNEKRIDFQTIIKELAFLRAQVDDSLLEKEISMLDEAVEEFVNTPENIQKCLEELVSIADEKKTEDKLKRAKNARKNLTKYIKKFGKQQQQQ